MKIKDIWFLMFAAYFWFGVGFYLLYTSGFLGFYETKAIASVVVLWIVWEAVHASRAEFDRRRDEMDRLRRIR